MWSTYLNKYQNELLQNVIPFWEKNCIDKEFGGYFTYLDRDGSVYDTDKYMWMQWRIVYMFATLYATKYKKDTWLEIAKGGYDFLTKYGKDDTGNYYMALNRKGEPIVAPYNVYSEAFVTMGAAALYKVTKEQKYKITAMTALNNYIQRIHNPNGPKGRWEKSMPARPKRLSLGHYMILANLGTIVKDNIGINDYEKEIDVAADMVCNKFWNQKYHILFENINPDYSFDLNSSEGRHLNPGHGLEACWFLLEYAERNNKKDLITKICNIIKGQLEFGWDKKYGGIYYFMDVLGKPHIELSWDMKLWWVHNETLISLLYAYRLTHDEKSQNLFLNWFKKVDEWTWSHFPDKKFNEDKNYGDWFGYLNRQGDPTHLLKGGRWKTFFHVPRSLLKCSEQIELIIKMK
jgi:N-acylglucosamine 2-epimerase